QPAASPGRVVLEGSGIAAQVAVHRLPDGALLVLGYDLRELRGVESMVASASGGAGLFALALALASAWFFRRELGRSVDALHRTIT
ncbi:sensor histidine kinase, partial [Citrobacter sp. AAK_AS5]